MAAWQPPKPNGHQDLVPERWERTDVDDRGVILAVYRGWVAASDPAHRLPDWHPGRLTGLWRALFDEEPELQAAVAEHLEETTSSFNRRIKGWLEQGVVQRSEMQDLLQQIESVKQLAQLLSRRSEASRNQSGAPWRTVGRPAARRAGNTAGGDRACPRARERGGCAPPADSRRPRTTCPSAHFPPPARR